MRLRTGAGTTFPGGRTAVVAAMAAWALTSCSDDAADVHGPHPSPSNAGACNDLPLVGGDGGMVLGADWSDEQHRYGAPVTLLVCATPTRDGRVRLLATGDGITVTPHSARVDPSGNGIVAFRVTVAPGAAGGLRVQQEGGVFGDTPGPAVVVEADGWHFAAAPQ